MPDNITIDMVTYELDYTRRRYGKTTYTWVKTTVNGERVQVGEWPCIRPKWAEVKASMTALLVDRGMLAVDRPSGKDQGF